MLKRNSVRKIEWLNINRHSRASDTKSLLYFIFYSEFMNIVYNIQRFLSYNVRNTVILLPLLSNGHHWFVVSNFWQLFIFTAPVIISEHENCYQQRACSTSALSSDVLFHFFLWFTEGYL